MVAHSEINHSGVFIFPRQDLTESEKIKEYGSVEEWGIYIIKAIDQMVFYRSNANDDGKTSYSKAAMSENIDLVRHGIFETEDYKKLIRPYGNNVSYEFPVDLTHYPIINKKIELLRGEEIARPFNFNVINCTDDSASSFQEERSNLIYSALQDSLIQLFQAREDPNNNDAETVQKIEQEFQSKLKEIEKYAEFSYSDHLEAAANSLLKYFIHNQDLLTLFNRNFFNYLCTGAEIYRIEVKDNEPYVRMVDPRFFDYDYFSFEDYIEDPMWCREVEYLTAAEIHARYYEYLEDEDVSYIERTKGFNATYPELDNFYGYALERSNSISSSQIRVGHYEWRGLKKVKILTYTDENGNELKEILPEDYKKKPGDQIESHWIPERWEGIRIGYELFIKVQPIEDQYTSIENLAKSQSRYIGIKANFSMVDKLKKYQYLYNITMYQLKLMMARNKGRAFIMDVAQIPFSKNWTVEKWLSYLDTHGIAFINSAELDPDTKERSSFNQFSAADRSTGEQIQFLIQQLEFVKNEMAEISGITNQREGNISASETYGGVERSVTQSSAITESLFWLHNQIKKKVLQRVLDIAKSTYKPGRKLSFILNNRARQVLEIPEDFSLGEFGVFVTDSGDESKVINEIMQLAQTALQQKEITLDKYIEARVTRSLSSMASIFREATQETNERANQQNQAAQQQQQAQIEADKQKIDFEYQKKLEIEQLKANTAIEVAKINAESRVLSFRTDMDADINDNGIADVVELDKLKLERERLELDRQTKNRELDIKEKDIQGKKELEAIKVDAERQKTDMELEKMAAQTEADVTKAKVQAESAHAQAQANQMNPAFAQQNQESNNPNI